MQLLLGRAWASPTLASHQRIFRVVDHTQKNGKFTSTSVFLSCHRPCHGEINDVDYSTFIFVSCNTLASYFALYVLCINSFIRDAAFCLSHHCSLGDFIFTIPEHLYHLQGLSAITWIFRKNFFVIEWLIGGTLCHLSLLIFPSTLLLIQSNCTWNIVTLLVVDLILFCFVELYLITVHVVFNIIIVAVGFMLYVLRHYNYVYVDVFYICVLYCVVCVVAPFTLARKNGFLLIVGV